MTTQRPKLATHPKWAIIYRGQLEMNMLEYYLALKRNAVLIMLQTGEPW